MDASELLQAIVDSPTRHAIVVTDPDGRILLWNRGASRIFRYRDDEIIGHDARELFAPDDLARGIHIRGGAVILLLQQPQMALLR